METQTNLTDKKREFINISVSPEEKRSITKAAITDCGISVSEYCRTKILTPKQEKSESETEVFANEEKELYEAKIMEQTNTINKLNAELVKIKVMNSNPGTITEEPVINSDDFVLPLNKTQREFLEKAIKIEADTFFGEDYGNFEKFIYKKIGDIISRNTDEINEVYKEGTPERAEVVALVERLKNGLKSNI